MNNCSIKALIALHHLLRSNARRNSTFISFRYMVMFYFFYV